MSDDNYGPVILRFNALAVLGDKALWECSMCGATVSNQRAHHEWHASIAAAQAAASGHPGWSIVLEPS